MFKYAVLLVLLASILYAGPVDTTKYYPVVDTTSFQKIDGKWTAITDTVWKSKIAVYLTPAEYDKLMELLHPKACWYDGVIIDTMYMDSICAPIYRGVDSVVTPTLQRTF